MLSWILESHEECSKMERVGDLAFSLAARCPNAIAINWTFDSIGCDTPVEATIELYQQQKSVRSGEVVLHSE